MNPCAGLSFHFGVSRAPEQITETDYNLDTKPEFINFRVTLPVAADEAITSVRFMPFFAVNLTSFVKEDFASLVFLQHDSPLAGSEFRTYANLRMHQVWCLCAFDVYPLLARAIRKEIPLIPRARIRIPPFVLAQVGPLNMRAKRTLYSAPYLSRPDLVTATDFSFEKFLDNSLMQNETLVLDAPLHQLWKTTTVGVAQDFSIHATLRVTEQDITYVPLPSEVIKFAFVQYFPIWYALGWLIKKTMKFVFTQQVLHSAVRDEVAKEHRA